MAFSATQLAALGAPLDRTRIAHRTEQGRTLSYLEGFDIMGTANAIFGYDGWAYTVTRLDLAAGVWVALVVVTVNAGGASVVREDVGVGIPAKARDAAEASPSAHETAIKGAVTDALKRALRGYGDAFGLSLYDKDGPDTTAAPAPARPAARVAAERPRPPTPVPAQAPIVPAGTSPAPAGVADRLLSAAEVKQLRGDVTATFRRQGWNVDHAVDAVKQHMREELGAASVEALTLHQAEAFRRWAREIAAGGVPDGGEPAPDDAAAHFAEL